MKLPVSVKGAFGASVENAVGPLPAERQSGVQECWDSIRCNSGRLGPPSKVEAGKQNGGGAIRKFA